MKPVYIVDGARPPVRARRVNPVYIVDGARTPVLK